MPAPRGMTDVRSTGRSDTVPRAEYGEILRQVKSEGLLNRTYGFYVALSIGLVLAFAAALTGLALSGSLWVQLLIAVLLGVILTQLAFLGHEASHRQVFTSKIANDRFGRVIATLFVGISYSWWMNKHTKHHANPNRIDHDPDIETDTIVFQPEKAQHRTRLQTWFVRHQGTLFFPLLMLEGINLHYQGMRYLLDRRNPVKGRGVEIALLTVRLLGLPALAFIALSPFAALGFLALQVAVFGVYMGASFAPNHKGMPQVPAEMKLSFFHKQVLTSRNVTGRGATAAFGGLNYQIEHHLFPNMPRPHLARAAQIVKDYCARWSIPYTAMSASASYRTVITHLNAVGYPDRDLFLCPLVSEYGRT